jgi:tRNA 2-thiouridine synthesizing protein A
LTEEELRNLNGTKVVDARGTSCPGPLLAAKRSITEIAVGGVMELLSSDTGTKRDVPLWAQKMGHEFLGVVDEAGFSRIFVKRMK